MGYRTDQKMFIAPNPDDTTTEGGGWTFTFAINEKPQGEDSTVLFNVKHINDVM